MKFDPPNSSGWQKGGATRKVAEIGARTSGHLKQKVMVFGCGDGMEIV